MEKFGYNQGWKRTKFLSCFYPIIFLAGLAAYWVLLVLPGDAQFKWWVPLLLVGLLLWASWEIDQFRRALGYAIELSEDFIRIGSDQAGWGEITRIEFRNAALDQPAIIMHTRAGKSLAVAAATDGIEYVKSYIEGRTKQTAAS